MDENPSIQKDDTISKFFEGYRVQTNPFGRNLFGERAFRRAERICAGIFLLTNHIGPEEPIRISIRKEALNFLGTIMHAKDETRASASQNTILCKSAVRQLISYARMLAAGGFVSIHNAQIVVEALDELASYISSSQRSPHSEATVLTKESFMDLRRPPSPSLKDIKDSEGQDPSKKDTEKDGIKASLNLPASHMSPRKQAILDILTAGQEFGIREVVAHLPELGEKTVQRELLQLVLMGKVRKNGFKRWSRYSRVP